MGNLFLAGSLAEKFGAVLRCGGEWQRLWKGVYTSKLCLYDML